MVSYFRDFPHTDARAQTDIKAYSRITCRWSLFWELQVSLGICLTGMNRYVMESKPTTPSYNNKASFICSLFLSVCAEDWIVWGSPYMTERLIHRAKNTHPVYWKHTSQLIEWPGGFTTNEGFSSRVGVAFCILCSYFKFHLLKWILWSHWNPDWLKCVWFWSSMSFKENISCFRNLDLSLRGFLFIS